MLAFMFVRNLPHQRLAAGEYIALRSQVGFVLQGGCVMRTYSDNWTPLCSGRGSALRILCIGLLLVLLGGCAGGLGERTARPCPSPIPAPVLQAGDTWSWQDERGAKWYSRYVRQTDDGLLEKEPRPGEPQAYYDHTHTLRKVFRDGQWITAATPEFPMLGKPQLDFPLLPGKSWSNQVPVRTPFGIGTFYQTFTVLGCKEVTVPAGTFFAVVIEEDQKGIGELSRGGGLRTWWYAPDVRYFVKLAHGREDIPGFWRSARNWALVSYRLAGGAVSQPGGPSASPPTAKTSPTVLGPVPAPVWKKGYEWKFRWTSPRGSGSFVSSVAGEEVIGGVAHYVVKSGRRETLYTKDELGWVMERVDGATEERSSPAERRFIWPLEMGKEWESRYEWEKPAERTTESRSRRHKVQAVETITVPAGTFPTFHITAEDPTGRLLFEYWYAPEVKWIIKDRFYFSYGVRERELTEYKPE